MVSRAGGFLAARRRRTVIPGRLELEGNVKGQVLLGGGPEVDVLGVGAVSTPWNASPTRPALTLMPHGLVTTDLRSTQSTSGSRRAMSLMHE